MANRARLMTGLILSRPEPAVLGKRLPDTKGQRMHVALISMLLAAGTDDPQRAQVTIGERISVRGPGNDWAGRRGLVCEEVFARLGVRKFEAIPCWG